MLQVRGIASSRSELCNVLKYEQRKLHEKIYLPRNPQQASQKDPVTHPKEASGKCLQVHSVTY